MIVRFYFCIRCLNLEVETVSRSRMNESTFLVDKNTYLQSSLPSTHANLHSLYLNCFRTFRRIFFGECLWRHTRMVLVNVCLQSACLLIRNSGVFLAMQTYVDILASSRTPDKHFMAWQSCKMLNVRNTFFTHFVYHQEEENLIIKIYADMSARVGGFSNGIEENDDDEYVDEDSDELLSVRSAGGSINRLGGLPIRTADDLRYQSVFSMYSWHNNPSDDAHTWKIFCYLL